MKPDTSVSHLVIATRDEFSESEPHALSSVLARLRDDLETGAMAKTRGCAAAAVQRVRDACKNGDWGGLAAMREEMVLTMAAIRRVKTTAPLSEEGYSELYGAFDVLVQLADMCLEESDAEAVLRLGGFATDVLRLIKGSPELSSGELAERLGRSMPQVSRATSDLRERGLVYATRIGKFRVWRATPKGERWLECRTKHVLKGPAGATTPPRAASEDLQASPPWLLADFLLESTGLDDGQHAIQDINAIVDRELELR